MLSREDKQLLTSVCGDAHMGHMLRKHWWILALPSETLVADGPPRRVKLFGTKCVSNRTTDGRVTSLDVPPSRRFPRAAPLRGNLRFCRRNFCLCF